MTEIDRSNFRTRASAPRNQPPAKSRSVPAPPSPSVPDIITRQDLLRLKHHLHRMLTTAGHSWAFGEHRPFDALVKHLPPILQEQVAAYRRGALLQRLAFGGIAAVLVLTIAIPVLNNFITTHRYDLSDATTQLLGPTDSSLVSKITYDSQTSSYYFNKTGIQTDVDSPAAALAAQVGGSSQDNKSLYSVQLPTDPTKGITYYDDNLNLSFSLTPQLKLMAPQEEQGRIVYPAGGGIQDVFTTKNNGLKDDIVLTKVGADTESYSYNLNLPNTLEAKMIEGTGEVGIYSADPALYNNITFGDNASKEDVMKARENGVKNNLVFVLPAPTIKEYDAKTHASVAAPASAHFVLSSDGKHLTVEASGLSKLTYPLTIDPSVVTTSTSDFAAGNNEDGNINYSTGNQISRGAVSGGTMSAGWTSATNNYAIARQASATVAYNGFIYEIGGQENNSDTNCKNAGTSNFCNDTQYAALNSNGSIGTWTTSTNYFSTPRRSPEAFAYDGYLYITGGQQTASSTACKNTGTNTRCSDTQYAALNSNGSIGTWTTNATYYTTAREDFSAMAYNGYMYILGGAAAARLNDVQYAPINADGSVGTWTTDSTTFSIAREGMGIAVYNGYIYIAGGLETNSDTNCKNTGTSVQYCNDVQAAPINSNGSVGTWSTVGYLPQGPDLNPNLVVNDGYLYAAGGALNPGGNTAVVEYAPIYDNGSIGAFNATASLVNGESGSGSAVYNGFSYIVEGENVSGTAVNAEMYAPFDNAGVAATTSWTTATPTTASTQANSCSVAYDGFLYNFGGYNGSTYSSTTQYVALNADGSLPATWSTTSNAFATGRSQLGCAGYNGYIYILGGTNGTALADVQYAPINTATGNTSAVWATASTPLPTATAALGAAVYNGYLYAVGGNSGSATTAVNYTALNTSTGAPGTWSSSTLLTATEFPSVLANNGYLYAVGGDNSSSPNGLNTVQVATINPSSGALSWSSSTYSFAARTMQSAAIWNGYLYIYGGWNNSTYNNDVNYAPLNSSGLPGTWATTTSFTTARYGAGAVSSNGFLYEIGGKASAGYESDTQYIGLNNGGNGASGTWTQATNNLLGPYPSFSGMRDSITAGANGFLYLLGGEPATSGSGGNATNGVYYAPINADGSPGTWTSTSSMNYTRASGTAIPYNGYMYVFGGYPSGATNNYDVEYALICTASNSGTGGCSGTPGTLGTWTLGTNFTNTSMESNLGAVEWNGYFYAMGGNTGSGPASTVDYAPINANGSVGTWTATSSLVTGVNIANEVVVNNGYIYVVGGIAAGSTPVGDIQYAQINPSTHAVGSFTDLPNALPYTQWYAGNVEVVDGYMYLSNGLGYQFGTSIGRGDTFYAAFGPNGLIGPWQHSSIMPTTHYASGGTYYNGYFYVVGGYKNSGPTYYPDIEFAPLSAIQATGHYTKLIDLGSATNTVYGITYNGFLGGGGLANISYKVAGSSAVFGSPGNAFSLIPSTCPTGTATTTTRYVWVNVALDDSQNLTFPDINGTPANVTDFTVNYAASIHPTPQTRLRGGQTLKSGTLSAFDTCFP